MKLRTFLFLLGCVLWIYGLAGCTSVTSKGYGMDIRRWEGYSIEKAKVQLGGFMKNYRVNKDIEGHDIVSGGYYRETGVKNGIPGYLLYGNYCLTRFFNEHDSGYITDVEYEGPACKAEEKAWVLVSEEGP